MPAEKMDGLTEFYVWLIEAGQGHEILFKCWAEDEDHATEQAENAYPSCEIECIYDAVEAERD